VLQETFQVRELEQKYVDSIVKSMTYFAAEATQPPIVHLMDIHKQDFKEKQVKLSTF
jgi:hypothetical protein